MVTGGTDEGEEVSNESGEDGEESGEDGGEAKDTSDFDTSNEDTAP